MNLFTPTPWLRNRHAQTLWGSVYPAAAPDLIADTLELPDGDCVGIQRTGTITGRPVVILMHGLEGSLHSPYVRYLLTMIAARDCCGILLQARGAAQRPNRLARNYHSGDWKDASHLAQHVRTAGATRVAAIGISLGANQLLKWLGEDAQHCPIDAGVAVSVPFDLSICVDAFERGFARLYQHHLMRLMRHSMLAKRSLLQMSRDQIAALRSVRGLDTAITAPVHGFKNVDDYYQRCSSRQFLKHIKRPTLIIQAADDPFVPKQCIPHSNELSNAIEMLVSPQGGHVGFLAGPCARPWLPNVIGEWLDQRFLNT